MTRRYVVITKRGDYTTAPYRSRCRVVTARHRLYFLAKLRGELTPEIGRSIDPIGLWKDDVIGYSLRDKYVTCGEYFISSGLEQEIDLKSGRLPVL